MDKHIEDFRKVIEEVLSQIDPEARRQFAKSFMEKLDEQKRTQENSGSSR